MNCTVCKISKQMNVETADLVQNQSLDGLVNHTANPLATDSWVEGVEWIIADHAVMPVCQYQKSFVRVAFIIAAEVERDQGTVLVQSLSCCRNAVVEGLLASLCVYDSGQRLTLIVELALFLSKIKLAHLDV